MNTFAQTRTSCRSLGSVQFPGTKFRYYSHSSKKSSLGNGYPWTSLGPGISHSRHELFMSPFATWHNSRNRMPFMHRNATNNTIHETCVGKASRETMHSSGVELKIWLKQGKEKRLPARKKRLLARILTKARKCLLRQNATKLCVNMWGNAQYRSA